MKNPTLSELRKASERERRRLPRWLRWLPWAAGLAALWAVAGFLVAPPIVRTQLEKRLGAELHRRVTVGKVRINPFKLTLAVESFSVAEPGGGPFVGWRRLFVDFELLSVVKRELRFKEIALDAFRANIAVDATGRLNFADLLEQPAAPAVPAKKPEGKSWSLRVDRLSVAEARIAYSDASRGEPFKTELGPTSVLLKNFSTGGPNQAPGEFSAVTEAGETLAWRGGLSLAPLRSSGEVSLGKIALKKYAPFYADRVHFDVLDGLLDVAGHYEFALDGRGPALSVSNGRVALQSLQLAKHGATEPVVSLLQIEAGGIAADLKRHTVEIGRFVITGGSVALQREDSGIDLAWLLMPVADEPAPTVTLPPASTSSVAVPTPSPAFEAKVLEFAIRDLALKIDDRTTPRPVHQELTGLTFDLRNFSLQSLATAMPFGLRVGVGSDAMIHAVGTVALSPMKADCAIELTNLSLAGFSPYAETFANARITQGSLTAAAKLHIELPPGLPPVIAVQGDVGIAGFSVVAADTAEEIASWRDFSLKGLDYSSSTPRLAIADIEWVEPAAHLIVGQDGALNLTEALRPPGAAPTVSLPVVPAAAPKQDDNPMFIALDHLGLENASIEFIDRSVQPNVRTVIGQLSGAIDGLASSALARASVDIRGKVDGIGPVAISGQINPLSAQVYTDLKLTMKQVELVPVSPYLGKYAGYQLARGSLALDVKCRVAQQKVDSNNVVTLDQFTLGRPTDSPDATSLPVSLALALLRDTSGRIVIDLPVQGRLDDPSFRVGRVVLRVITNLLVKAATSPFSLIGAMFGGGKGDELSFQQFAPGEISLDEDDVNKLDVVAKALRERPTLRLDIAGAYDEAADAPVLRERALEDQMRHLVWLDRSLVEPGLTPEEIVLDPVQKMGMVRRLYYKTYPNEMPKRAVVKPVAVPSGPVAGARGNLGSFSRSQPATVTHSASPAQPQAVAPGAEPEKTDGQAPTSLEVMKEKLLARIAIDDESLRRLAAARAQTVRDYLVNRGEVPAERLSLVNTDGKPPKAGGTRVDLHLK